LSRVDDGGRASAAPPAAERLRGRRARTDGAARARRAPRGTFSPRGDDVEGHAAAPRDRAGAGRNAAPPPAGRADERAGSRRPANRSDAARGVATARDLGAPELASAQRSRARLRPRRDPPRREGRCGGSPRRPRPRTRNRARDGSREARRRGNPGRRAAHRRRGGGRGRAGLRRARPDVDARGRLPRGGGGRDVVSAIPVIVGYGLREALRRRVFAVVLLLTIVFLVLFWVANHYVHRELGTLQVPSDVPVDARTFASAFLSGLALFATMLLGVLLAVSLTLGAA